MNSKFKNIIAVLLLLIFPISAIGLNFSVHKCMHKGTIQFSFFDSSKANGHFNYCCTLDDTMNSGKLQHSSIYHKTEKRNAVDVCCDSKISKQNIEITKSECKSVNIEKKKTERDSKSSKENDKYENIGLAINYLNSPCCSNSNVNYIIKFEFMNVDSKTFLFEIFLGSNSFFHKENFDKYNDKLSIKNIKYPIKELIYNIISFIHFTSITGDDSDVPYLIFC